MFIDWVMSLKAMLDLNTVQRSRRRWILTAAVILGVGSPIPSVGRTPQFPDVNLMKASTAAGYPYVTGGFSMDEKKAMERVSAPYNLRLSFARRSGVYMSPVTLLIGDNKGQRVESIAVRAPWLFIQLPTGSYTVVARFKQQIVIIRNVYIREGGKSRYFLRGD